MIDFMVRDNSPFTDEGKNLLIEEFGKNYGTYFSILSAISGGYNTQTEIEALLGEKSLGGYLKRLIEDYNIVVRQRPVFSKEGSQTVRYGICDNFIHFWFNYFDRNRSLIEIKNFIGLRKLIKTDYPTYSGKILEQYFKQKYAESYEFRLIGSWWEPKGNQNEIDIVVILLDNNSASMSEISTLMLKSQGKHVTVVGGYSAGATAGLGDSDQFNGGIRGKVSDYLEFYMPLLAMQDATHTVIEGIGIKPDLLVDPLTEDEVREMALSPFTHIDRTLKQAIEVLSNN